MPRSAAMPEAQTFYAAGNHILLSVYRSICGILVFITGFSRMVIILEMFSGQWLLMGFGLSITEGGTFSILFISRYMAP